MTAVARQVVGYTRRVTLPGAQPRGWFITIEGPDGSGKTTQATALATHLASRGLDVHVTREPGGTWLGERLRDVLLARTTSAAATDPLTDALLFNAARRQLVTEVIRPALAAGTTVVCARFADSTLAYQGYGAGVPLERLRVLEEVATDGLTPDLTILLDLAGRGRPGAQGARRRDPLRGRVRPRLPPPGAGRFPGPRGGRTRAGSRSSMPGATATRSRVPSPARPTGWSAPVNRIRHPARTP